ncbi:MAG: efflux RND transporter permease subunit [Phycisphaerae bacterium]|nr:MAG: hypothetical protein EDS66_00810 [Planctomycetota bacterium]KAB2945429.1 MAG: hypothetical protein F9K17_09910 [Phycisphaerae bacterium]MCK6464380.1 efflux RND transporter permease subunit [Phycisphaerae bacterium]MCQ3920202.1 hypothetical protein [Planctomycetota bacterium]NUQ07670.1 efflux RND transporter permease subunit [Phycisphaerae bacterium]
MDPIKFVIHNPVKVAVGVALIVLFGFRSVFEIPKQLTPDVDRPFVTVTTMWTGASPQEVESEIIDRQEEKLKSVKNVVKMTSTAQEGMAVVKLEFPVGVDKNAALRDVSDKLRQVEAYPEEVDEPTVVATDDDMENTIAWMILSSGKDFDVAKIKTFVEDNVKPLLERAEGIAEVDVYGGLEREVQVVVDAPKLAARGLTFSDLDSALRRQNRNVSAGTILQGKRDFAYRTVGEFTSLREIEETVIAYREGGPVLVRDVATVVDGFKKPISFVKSKGEFVIAMPARKETGANVLTAMDNLKRQIEVVNRDILRPMGLDLSLSQVYDETTYINGAIDLVIQNIWVGGLLTIVVLFLFLRSPSATGVIAVAIPISIIGTFLVIHALGRTLNVVMLAGLAFAVGMVVDNAIVVLENTYRHRMMGKPRFQAAFDGAREVWTAVLASTLTTMAVFIPVVTIQEETGQLFKDIAIAISAAVGLSLLVSVLVIPTLAARVLGGEASVLRGDKPWFFAEWVGSLNRLILRRAGSRVAVVLGLTALSIVGSWLLAPDLDYLPEGNRNLVFGFLISPPGYSVEEFKQMAAIVEDGAPEDPTDGVRHSWEAAPGSAEAAALPPVEMMLGPGGTVPVQIVPPPIQDFFFVSFGGGAFMGCTSKDEMRVRPLVNYMSHAAMRVPGVFPVFFQFSLFNSGTGSGNAVDVDIRGDNLGQVVSVASALQGAIMGRGYNYPQPNPGNFDLGRPEIRMTPKRAQAADVGLTTSDVGFILRACVEGAFVGEYNDRGDKIDMAIKIARDERAPLETIAGTPIFTPRQHIVPLSSVVLIERTTAPQQINHIEQMPSVTLSVQPKPGVPLQTTMDDLSNEVIAPMRTAGVIPPSVFVSLSGTAGKLTQTRHALIGDFQGLVRGPRLLAGSATLTMAALGLLAVIGSLAVGARYGRRWGMRAIVLAACLLALGFFAYNYHLTFELIQSRMMLAVIITYLLMAALFESFAYPFVILFSVPLAVVGGFATLRWVSWRSSYDPYTPIQQLDVVTMLGFVILIGVVVNNAILIVHQSLNEMREGGLSHTDAVIKSVRTRTRPIFMTAMTTVFGTLPLVLMTGPGSELYRGIGSVMTGGLTASTIFTLVLVPALFSLFMDLKVWIYGEPLPEERHASAGADAPTETKIRPAAGSRPEAGHAAGTGSPVIASGAARGAIPSREDGTPPASHHPPLAPAPPTAPDPSAV